jgi:hypothetical protein
MNDPCASPLAAAFQSQLPNAARSRDQITIRRVLRRYRMSAARSSSSINLSMRRINSGLSTTVTSGSDATPQCSALDYLKVGAVARQLVSQGRAFDCEEVEARKTDLGGERAKQAEKSLG